MNNRYLMEELLDYDIESILLNRVKDVFPHHQKIIDVFDGFWLNAVSTSVDKERSRKHDYTKKVADNEIRIAHISSQINQIQNELAAAALRKNVLEKPINNVIIKQEKIEEKIKKEISQGESYALEIVDLQEEIEEIKKKKKLKWTGLKKASSTYKSALQFYMEVIDCSESYDKIRFCFFQSKTAEVPQYYANIILSDDSWRVDLIHPSLKQKYGEKLKYFLNIRNNRDYSELTEFLCMVRRIFKQMRKT